VKRKIPSPYRDSNLIQLVAQSYAAELSRFLNRSTYTESKLLVGRFDHNGDEYRKIA
jgi:hypothetical protein